MWCVVCVLNVSVSIVCTWEVVWRPLSWPSLCFACPQPHPLWRPQALLWPCGWDWDGGEVGVRRESRDGGRSCIVHEEVLLVVVVGLEGTWCERLRGGARAYLFEGLACGGGVVGLSG